MAHDQQRSEEDASLTILAGQEKQFNALYRAMTDSMGLPDCAMWVLYFLVAETRELSQHDLVQLMMFPKQTIHSAVAVLRKQGLIELEASSGTRGRKRIHLTEAGKELTRRTVCRIREAELQTIRDFGLEKMKVLLSLQREFIAQLQHNTQPLIES